MHSNFDKNIRIPQIDHNDRKFQSIHFSYDFAIALIKITIGVSSPVSFRLEWIWICVQKAPIHFLSETKNYSIDFMLQIDCQVGNTFGKFFLFRI